MTRFTAISTLFLLHFSFYLNAQKSTTTYEYPLQNTEIQSFKINIPEDTQGDFLSFSFRIEKINHPESIEITLSQSTSQGEIKTEKINLDEHSYQEETKDKDHSFYSELVYIPHNIKVLELKIKTKVEQITEESRLILRLYNPFFQGMISPIEIDSQNICEKPTIRTRTQWICPDGDSCLHGILTYTTVTHLIVHHSAGSNTSTNWDAVMRSIWDFHVNTNGWIDIGYNFLVAPNGVVYEGRAGGDNVQGAHFSSMNSHTMGVCVLGTYSSVIPSNIALQSTARILGWKAQKEGLNPFDSAMHTAGFIPRIAGHRSSGSGTECPGDSLYAHLTDLRQLVKNCLDGVLFIPEKYPSNALIYPNPVDRILNIEISDEAENNIEFILYDFTGKEIRRNSFNDKIININMAYLAQGIYFIQLKSSKGILYQGKIVKS